MKKLFFLTMVAVSLLSCKDGSSDTTTTTTNTTDTTTHAARSGVYAPSQGDATYRNGKLLVYHDGEWREADNDVTLDNGVVVKRNGEVVRGDKVVVLDDGEVVDKSGRFFDKAGDAIDDAWDATKKGVKKAGEEVKDVFSDKDKDKKK
ncbi:MAG: DUF6799 domain-containing protein [Flavisolibacter sp.]